MGRKLQIRTSRNILEAEPLSTYFKSMTTPTRGFGVLERGGGREQPWVWWGVGVDPSLICFFSFFFASYVFEWHFLRKRTQKYLSALRKGHTSEGPMVSAPVAPRWVKPRVVVGTLSIWLLCPNNLCDLDPTVFPAWIPWDASEVPVHAQERDALVSYKVA